MRGWQAQKSEIKGRMPRNHGRGVYANEDWRLRQMSAPDICPFRKHAGRARDGNAPAPAIPTGYRMGRLRLSLFATISQFSTLTDKTLDDLRIELFFPADNGSAAILRVMGQT